MVVFSYDMHTFFVFDHEIAFLVENIGIIDSFFFTQAKCQTYRTVKSLIKIFTLNIDNY
jgi:hypothetical protein